MKRKEFKKQTWFSRRDFIKTTAAAGVAAMFSSPGKLFAAGSDKIRIGIVGCGKRGNGAVMDCLTSAEGVELVAVGDMFKEHIDTARENWTKQIDPAKLKLTDDKCFVGFDAYKKVIACDVDLVLFATPPHFRPMHLKAAIEAGKHAFIEKPVAVDPVGIRSIIASSELAEQKGLAIVAGTQRRHHLPYLDIIKKIHDGQIGTIVSGQCYWNGGDVGPWGYLALRKPEYSDMEWQIRNWYFFTWLSGDHYVEQHVHNIDVMNWAIGSHPIRAMGLGGRQSRTAPENGNIYDHFAVEFEYPNGARVLSTARQIDGTSIRVSERVVGTKGSSYTDGGSARIEGEKPYTYEGESNSPTVQEHTDLINSIRAGKPLNEGKRIAESTMTAIMGRMSAYTGRELQWDWVMNKSQLDLSPPKYEFGNLPVDPVAIPGKTQLV